MTRNRGPVINYFKFPTCNGCFREHLEKQSYFYHCVTCLKISQDKDKRFKKKLKGNMYNLCRTCTQMKGLTHFGAHNRGKCEMKKDSEKKEWKCCNLSCDLNENFKSKHLSIDKWRCSSCPDTYLCFNCCQLPTLEDPRKQYAYIKKSCIDFHDKFFKTEDALSVKSENCFLDVTTSSVEIQ